MKWDGVQHRRKPRPALSRFERMLQRYIELSQRRPELMLQRYIELLQRRRPDLYPRPL